MTARQLALEFPHAAAMGQQDFVRSDSNALAADALEAWPDWPSAAQGVCAYALHGPKGSGKTHLAAIWAARAGAHWRAAATLDDQGLEPIQDGTALVVDGLNTSLDLNRAAQETLLHHFNLLSERGGFLLVTGDAPPARLALSLPDLASRLGTIATLPIAWPDDSLMAALLTKFLSDRQLRAAPNVIRYLLDRIERTPSAAQACVAALDRASLVAGRAITIPLARAVLDQTSEERKGRD